MLSANLIIFANNVKWKLDMDSESVIYIIIFAAIFVINIIKNVKKNNSEQEMVERKQAQMTRDVVSQSDDDTVIIDQSEVRRRLQEEIEIQRREQERIEQLRRKEKQMAEKRKNEAFLATEEGASAIVNLHENKKAKNKNVKQQQPIVVNEEEDSVPVNLNLEDYDEVRRAFIYAEIFNRKY